MSKRAANKVKNEQEILATAIQFFIKNGDEENIDLILFKRRWVYGGTNHRVYYFDILEEFVGDCLNRSVSYR